jgi:hypothetical protein
MLSFHYLFQDFLIDLKINNNLKSLDILLFSEQPTTMLGKATIRTFLPRASSSLRLSSRRQISHDALIVGYYKADSSLQLSDSHNLPASLSSKLNTLLHHSKAKANAGELRLFHVTEEAPDLGILKHIALVGLGEKESTLNAEQELDAHGMNIQAENTRKAVIMSNDECRTPSHSF